MSNLQVTREKLPTGTAEPQISGFFSKLLEDGEHRLETIARHCGFTSAEILRRLFQRRMGLSPTAYRERFASAR
jgi:methylphosphotriester-DNA--protein-cysteine methyltransferase